MSVEWYRDYNLRPIFMALVLPRVLVVICNNCRVSVILIP